MMNYNLNGDMNHNPDYIDPDMDDQGKGEELFVAGRLAQPVELELRGNCEEDEVPAVGREGDL